MVGNDPDSTTKHLDLFAKIFLGIVGAAITVILGVGQLRLGNIQHDLAERQMKLKHELSAQQAELQTLATVSQYLGLMGEPGATGERAKKVITAAAEHLSEKYNSQFLAKLADELLAGEDLQIREATEPIFAEPNWFAVLASYGEDQLASAIDHAKRLASTLLSQGATEYQVVVYKTQISRHYAITLGGRMPEVEAVRLAQRARAQDWAGDAFAQVDRNWTEVKRIKWHQ